MLCRFGAVVVVVAMSFIADVPGKLWRRLDKSVVTPLRQMPPTDRLMCLSVGVVGGMFPVPFLTTVVTFALIAALRLTGARLQPAAVAVATAVNLLVAPADVAAIPLFARAAAALTGADASSFTAEFLMAKMGEGLMPLLQGAAAMLLHAILAWALVGGVAMVAVVGVVRSRGTRKIHVDG